MSAVQALLDGSDERTVRFVSKDGVLPDLFITCASFNFLVHEKVVVEKCEFFRGAMTVPMKEKTERKIAMSEKNPFVVQALLFYIYKGTYHDSPVNEIDQDSALALDVQIYHAAHEYQMDELKQLATSKVMRLVGSIANPNAVDELGFYKGVELAYHNHHLHELGEELTPRKALTCACARDFSHLKHYDGVQRALREVPDFAADVLYWKC